MHCSQGKLNKGCGTFGCLSLTTPGAGWLTWALPMQNTESRSRRLTRTVLTTHNSMHTSCPQGTPRTR